MPWPVYPFIINVPHGSAYIPGEERAGLVLTDQELDRELSLVTDLYLGDLAEAGQPLGVVHRFRYSLLLVDPEQPRDGRGEASPVRTRTSTGGPLRLEDDQERERLLTRYYDPHQASLEAAIKFQVGNFGWGLIINLYTFLKSSGINHSDSEQSPAGIIIKTDPIRTPQKLVGLVENYWRNQSVRVVTRKLPLAARLPGPWDSPTSTVQSITMALNRDLYLTPGGDKLTGFQNLKSSLAGLFDWLLKEYQPDLN